MTFPPLVIYCDGGSRGNPGSSACAFLIYSTAGQLIHRAGVFLGLFTNNQAEYFGVIHSLQWLQSQGCYNAVIEYRLDSLLVVNQLKGLYKIKDEQLRHLHSQAVSLIAAINPQSISFQHIPRSQNSAADHLVNLTLDSASK